MSNRNEPVRGRVRAYNRPRMARAGAALTTAAMVALAGALSRPAAAVAQASPACTTATIQAPAGPVCGVQDTATVAGAQVTVPVYRGIPYAAAPVGSLRWQPTDSLAPWSSTLQATAFGHACIQGKVPVDTTLYSEDCLFLNVWTPPSASASHRVPVMVFVHGGAFIEGRGSSPMYNGAYMAAADTAVVVTLNYRLGALGFLYYANGKDTVAGNFGLLDQQRALKWVRNNIGAFGGDTSKVMLFGESAGAMSVGFHLFAMPSSQPYFRAAIMESNPMGVLYRSPGKATSDGTSYVTELCKTEAAVKASCDVIGLRGAWFRANAASASVNDVLSAQNTFDTTGVARRLIEGGQEQGLPWTPTIDGKLVTGQPLAGYASGVTRRKPYVFGFNRDEGVVFAAAAASLLNPSRYNDLLDRIWGLKAGSVRGFKAGTNQPYNADSAASVAGMAGTPSALSDLMTDMVFKCGNLAAADSGYTANQANSAKPPIFAYLFQRSPIPFELYPGVEPCTAASGMVCHADELPYVFNSLAWADTTNGNTVPVAAADTSVSRQMVAAWGSFAKNPTQSPVAGWTAYSTNGAVYPWTGSTNGPVVTNLASTASCSALWFGLTPLKNGSAVQAARPAGARHAGGARG